MIKATEARKVAAEAREAISQELTLKRARELKKLFEQRLSDADSSIKGAVSVGNETVILRYDYQALPSDIRQKFIGQLSEAGYHVTCYTGDNGIEILVSWKESN